MNNKHTFPPGRRWPWCLALCVALAGCGNLAGKRPSSAATYDLGLPEPITRQGGLVPATLEVRAPSWLSSTGMQYRLEYSQPSPRRIYLESRWASPPSELVEVSLRRVLSPDGRGGCRLRVELDEFTQVYTAEGSSQAVVVARAELLAPRGDTVVARRDLRLSEPSPSPDAAGGVIGHRHATRRLTDEISAWLGGAGWTPDDAAAIQRACGK